MFGKMRKLSVGGGGGGGVRFQMRLWMSKEDSYRPSDSSLATAFSTSLCQTFEYAIETWQNLFGALICVCIDPVCVSIQASCS